MLEPVGHSRLDWQVAPGSGVPASRLQFDRDLGSLARAITRGRPVRVYLLGPRVPAQHYEFPTAVTDTPARLRLYPAPAEHPPLTRIALRDPAGSWHVVECAPAPAQAQEPVPAGTGSPVPRGLIVDLVGVTVPLTVDRAPASGNLVLVRHGATTTSTLGSGDASQPGQRLRVPKAPVAADLSADGTPVSTLEVRVDGLRWQERQTLSGAGPQDVYSTVLEPDGAVTVVSGDGRQGNRLRTGRNNVTASYRVGGGTEGEVPAGAISSLLGSVRGVKRVVGAGPTSGGADQDDPHRLRRLVPGRSRAGDRAVSRSDLADLALAFPGVVARDRVARRRSGRLRLRRQRGTCRVPSARYGRPAPAGRRRGGRARRVPGRAPGCDGAAVRGRGGGHRAAVGHLRGAGPTVPPGRRGGRGRRRSHRCGRSTVSAGSRARRTARPVGRDGGGARRRRRGRGTGAHAGVRSPPERFELVVLAADLAISAVTA